jgi:hypothetical protein
MDRGGCGGLPGAGAVNLYDPPWTEAGWAALIAYLSGEPR